MPDCTVNATDTFGINCNWKIPAFSHKTSSHVKMAVPEIDPHYRFDEEVTLAILAGFMHNKRVLLQGMHGSGKSSHIEQIAARLGWQCVRVNLDGHINRLDLVGRDAVVVRDGKQVTEFQEGIVPFAARRPIALIFDEYDAGRADVMFVLQRLLERQGRFMLLEQNESITPHPYFRLFATANTIGLGNTTGLYHGAQKLNQAQLDRWDVVAKLEYPTAEQEHSIVRAHVPSMDTEQGRAQLDSMIALANLTRSGFRNHDIATVMSPRTVIMWAENTYIFGDVQRAFRFAFLHRCDEAERPIIAEYFQRCFGEELR